MHHFKVGHQRLMRFSLPCHGATRRLAATVLTSLCLITHGNADQKATADRAAIDLSRLDGQIVVQSDEAIKALDDFSFDLEVRFSKLQSGNFFSANNDWNQDGFYFQFFEDHLVLGFGDHGEFSQVTTPPDLLRTGQWYRLSGVKEGASARLFIDGEQIAQQDVGERVVDSDADLIIGPTGYAPAAEISRFRLWSSALRSDEIEDLDGASELPTPLIHYDFGVVEGFRVDDLAGDEQVGIITTSADHADWVRTASTDEASAKQPSERERAPNGIHVLDLSNAEDALIVDGLTMPDRGEDFALRLDLMLTDLRPGVIAHAESEQGTFFSLEHDADHLWLTVGDRQDSARIIGPAGILEPGQWMSVTAMHDGGRSKLLINGIQVASFETQGATDGSPMRLAVGGSERAAAFQLGALGVWERAFDAGESHADVLSMGDPSDSSLLLAFGPWERPPAGSSLDEKSGRGPEGRLLGNPADLWIDVDLDAVEPLSPDRVRLALDPQRRDRRADASGQTSRTEQRAAALEDLFRIPQGRSRIMTLSAPAETVIVDDENVARAEVLSPRKVFLFGAHAGRTGVRALDSNGELIEEATIRVGADADAAEQELSAIAGGEDNRFTDRGGQPVLEGPADDVGEAIALDALSKSPAIGDVPASNQTTIDAAQQVNIKVRFAEVSRNDLDRLGINWNAVINGGALGDAAAGQFFLADSLLDAAGSVSGQIEAGDVDINFLLEALQQAGAVSMLAEPNLTVLNGEEARFLAGGELPIPIPQDSNGATTVAFKPFGVSLDFRPVILGNNRISLRVTSEVSDISAQGAVQLGSLFVPAISVRRAETSLELASGQTFAVGGLFNRTVSRDIAQIPGLGSIPILGALFRSTRYQRSETELVILITPYLVRPVDDPGELAFPGQTNGPIAAKRSGEESFGAGFIVR